MGMKGHLLRAWDNLRKGIEKRQFDKDSFANRLLGAELANFVPHFDVQFNPFFINPFKQHTEVEELGDRYIVLWALLCGMELSTYIPEKERANYEKKWWQMPHKGYYGLFDYLIGLPFHLLYSIPSLFGVVSIVAGSSAYGVMRAIAKANKSFGVLTLLASVLLAVGLALPLALVSFASGFIYGVGKAALYPINWIAQRVVIPAVSLVSLAFMTPLVLFVHVALSKQQAKAAKQQENGQWSSTAGVVDRLMPGARSVEDVVNQFEDPKVMQGVPGGVSDTVRSAPSPSTMGDTLVPCCLKIKCYRRTDSLPHNSCYRE